jgi:putative transposase
MKYQNDTYYHIYNRGANKEDIFFEEENYRYLLSLISKYSLQYKITIAAYCLMPNHYHIIAGQQLSGSLGSFLRTTFNAYTQAINNRFNRSGTLFQSQVKVKEITSDGYCLQVIRYVHLNPVTAKMVSSAEK